MQQKTQDKKEQILMKIAEVNAIEGAWIDSVMIEKYPKFFVWLGNIAVTKKILILQDLTIFLTRTFGYTLDIKRGLDITPTKKGFQKGSILFNSLTVKISMRGEQIAEKEIKVNLVIPKELRKLIGF